MSNVKVSESVIINASKSAVWSVLADFPNIADWTGQVKSSRRTSEAHNGLGAERTCELAPFGSLDERIIGWEPEQLLQVDVHTVSKMPIKRSVTTFTLREIDANTTEVTMAPEAEAKGGLMSGLIAKRLEKALPKAALQLLDDLKVAVEGKSEAAA